ncbi:hypothetical protein CROQUDRAFT_59310 [Cronartium quercuum f. sp. fusiforme G11]|uniref:Uncharacterized protein n=1 Tax=Cronartium quercuum f. sp. fusiforme G11 TaxID=708437 RepID=A0A9P6TEB2_9BASI|nr:hypothetical protein CROQUDRAFT_59310 [Cronartium quercuum f. sp. fusiforme G11]
MYARTAMIATHLNYTMFIDDSEWKYGPLKTFFRVQPKPCVIPDDWLNTSSKIFGEESWSESNHVINDRHPLRWVHSHPSINRIFAHFTFLKRVDEYLIKEFIPQISIELFAVWDLIKARDQMPAHPPEQILHHSTMEDVFRRQADELMKLWKPTESLLKEVDTMQVIVDRSIKRDSLKVTDSILRRLSAKWGVKPNTIGIGVCYSHLSEDIADSEQARQKVRSAQRYFQTLESIEKSWNSSFRLCPGSHIRSRKSRLSRANMTQLTWQLSQILLMIQLKLCQCIPDSTSHTREHGRRVELRSMNPFYGYALDHVGIHHHHITKEPPITYNNPLEYTIHFHLCSVRFFHPITNHSVFLLNTMTLSGSPQARPRIQTRFHHGIQPRPLHPNRLAAPPRAGLRGYCIDRVGAKDGYDLSPSAEEFDPCPFGLKEWQPRVRDGPENLIRPLISATPSHEADVGEISLVTWDSKTSSNTRNGKRSRNDEDSSDVNRSVSFSYVKTSPISRKRARRTKSYSNLAAMPERDIADCRSGDNQVSTGHHPSDNKAQKTIRSFEMSLKKRRKTVDRPTDIYIHRPIER